MKNVFKKKKKKESMENHEARIKTEYIILT